jgi:hypothetical protein
MAGQKITRLRQTVVQDLPPATGERSGESIYGSNLELPTTTTPMTTGQRSGCPVQAAASGLTDIHGYDQTWESMPRARLPTGNHLFSSAPSVHVHGVASSAVIGIVVPTRAENKGDSFFCI